MEVTNRLFRFMYHRASVQCVWIFLDLSKLSTIVILQIPFSNFYTCSWMKNLTTEITKRSIDPSVAIGNFKYI